MFWNQKLDQIPFLC